MRSTLVTTALSAAAIFALGGCTITTYSYSDPPPKAKAAQTPSPTTTARRPAKPRYRAGNAGTTTPASTTTRPTTTATDLAPKITSPIIFGNGTGGAFTGHAYVIPDTTTRLPDLSSLVPFATFYTDSFNIPSQEFKGGFPGALVQEDWFAIRYEGKFTAAKDGAWEFKVTSDDGAILYIDGQKVVDNDGVHTAKTTTGRRELRAGVHQLRLDYFQAKKGAAALVVRVVESGTDRLLTGTK